MHSAQHAPDLAGGVAMVNMKIFCGLTQRTMSALPEEQRVELSGRDAIAPLAHVFSTWFLANILVSILSIPLSVVIPSTRRTIAMRLVFLAPALGAR